LKSFITVKLTINKIVVTKAEEINQVKSKHIICQYRRLFHWENFFSPILSIFWHLPNVFLLYWLSCLEDDDDANKHFWWVSVFSDLFFQLSFQRNVAFFKYIFATFLCRVMQNNFVMDIVRFFSLQKNILIKKLKFKT